MPFIEAPSNFYLGRRYDPAANKLADDVVYYDARDLVTHAVVLGMTGSGKTGLCISMLEEALLDNIPALIIDPKGDITNLLLTFPQFRPEDFGSWVNEDDARRARMDVPSYAADVASRWKDGLASWGITPTRVEWLKRTARYSIYTPGSEAGLPVSILASLAAPHEGWAGNEEPLREKINGIVTALLGLIGRDAQAVQSKEHILISNIFEYNWSRGINLTVEDIILQVQKPPFTKLGAADLDSYMPEKARFKLAMDLNNIVAAPSFQSWVRSEPLDIQNLLFQPNGRARASIFYIAHLNEAERQFIITLLLENVQSWMRQQSGTTGLRAILYIDEMFGYFPPYPKNPPTKDPILRLLKQARAFGLGLILATQNPGDLDYKGLSNAGTWLIGRLQSDNDKARVMAGLESLAAADNGMNLQDVQRLIADIAPRVFLLHNVHNPGGPLMVHTRWCMSYLRGPLTRQQVQTLMADQKQALASSIAAAQPRAINAPPAPPGFVPSAPPAPPGFAPPAPPPAPPGFAPSAPPAPPTFSAQSASPSGWTQQITQPVAPLPSAQDSQMTTRGAAAPPGFATNPPAVPTAIPQIFLPASVSSDQAIQNWAQQTSAMVTAFGGSSLAYRPVLLGQAVIRYQDRKTQLFINRPYAFHVPDVDRSGMVRWENYQAVPIDPRRVSGVPLGAALYADMPPGLMDAKRIAALRTELVDMLYNTARLEILFNAALNIYANPEAHESEFWSQVQQVAREKRDAEIDALSGKYEQLMDRVEDKLKRKERELSAEKKELADLKREELFTRGETLLSLFKGRTAHTLSRSSRVTRYRRQSDEDLKESVEVIQELETQMEKLQGDYQRDIQASNEKWAAVATQSQTYTVTPFKKDIQVELFGVGWIPYYYAVINNQPLLLPAYF